MVNLWVIVPVEPGLPALLCTTFTESPDGVASRLRRRCAAPLRVPQKIGRCRAAGGGGGGQFPEMAMVAFLFMLIP